VHLFVLLTLATLGLLACAGGQPARRSTSPAGETAGAIHADDPVETAGDADPAPAPEGDRAQPSEFVIRDSEGAKDAHGSSPSKIKATATEAALKFVVVDKDKGPIAGIVISLTSPDGKKYYTDETDAQGYAEVLVPVAQKYDLVYLSLGRREIAATVNVTEQPNQTLRLTLRYKRYTPAADASAGATQTGPGIVLKGVNFDTGKASLRADSFAQFDSIVEYMTHKNSARVEISGHTDNVGNPKANKTLSMKRAQACRDYLISKGIDDRRIEAVGHGSERPIAANDDEQGRQQNRRIEAREL
jgi:outer membrane protein OmpA-like peptidoglycan-associated protein